MDTSVICTNHHIVLEHSCYWFHRPDLCEPAGLPMHSPYICTHRHSSWLGSNSSEVFEQSQRAKQSMHSPDKYTQRYSFWVSELLIQEFRIVPASQKRDRYYAPTIYMQLTHCYSFWSILVLKLLDPIIQNCLSERSMRTSQWLTSRGWKEIFSRFWRLWSNFRPFGRRNQEKKWCLLN